ncbi:PrsW family intramembrane metalloprotease [Candidatus Parcubacteria bacterium]|nr:PrsW family intramembrane metalloprotease [Candidatus Parcubacteria bacterium]
MTTTTTIFLSFLAGFIPALIWLFYFLWQDKKNPEPGWRIFSSFVYGMLAVPVAIAFQYLVNTFVLQDQAISSLFYTDYFIAITGLFLWASIEEILKYIAAHKGGISKKSNDEPIDPIIYMVTAAIGFSALENTLFILNPLLHGETYTALLTGNMRFIGSSLLHIVSSAIIGLFIAFSYYKTDKIKKIYVFYGIFLSIVLHTMFNSFIIRGDNFTLIGFITVWISIIAIIMLFEKVKRIYKPLK